MRLTEEIDANIKTLSGDTTYTLDDRALLAQFCAKVLDSDPIKAMKVDRPESLCGSPGSSPYLTRRKEYRWPRPAKNEP